MYQIFGVKWLATAYAVVAAVVAVISMAVEWVGTPPAAWGWPEFVWKPVSLGLTVSAALLWLFGQTRLFPAACRHRWACNIFPDLDGEWTGELMSNWPVVEARGVEDAEKRELFARPAKARIHASLLSVTMTLETKDKYSTSRTVLVGVTKGPNPGECSLIYAYENRTPSPKNTDEQFHYGAAVLTFQREGRDLVLIGPYWTNRNWKKGLNTAGTAKFKKCHVAA